MALDFFWHICIFGGGLVDRRDCDGGGGIVASEYSRYIFKFKMRFWFELLSASISQFYE